MSMLIKVPGVDQQYDNSDTVKSEDDLVLYKKSIKEQEQEKINEMLIINEQILSVKKDILDKISNTFLFPYILEMRLLIGNYNGIQVTDSVEKLIPYTNIINKTLGTNIKKEIFYNWLTFELKTNIKSNVDKTQKIGEIFSYIVMKLTSTNLDYFAFTIYDDEILSQESTFALLDKNKNIKEIKEVIEASKRKEND